MKNIRNINTLIVVLQDAEIVVLPMDLSDFATVPFKVQQAIACYGHIDILVNCAGMSYRGKVALTLLDVHMKLMNVNYFGQIAITRGLYA